MQHPAKTSNGGHQSSVPVQPGPVMVIGGAEDKLKDRVILQRFVRLAGGPDATIIVISTASSLGELATELYRELFGALGATRVSGLRPLTRQDANDPACASALDGASGIFLTGGNQLRLSSVIVGTALGNALVRAHERGVVVGGTSAGASAVSTHMMAFGTSGATPKHRMAQVSSGLGLLKNLVVDQHFEQRTRLGRLLAVVAQSPNLIGLGVDEDTAAVVSPDQTFEVIGRGAVTVVDGSNVVTDAFYTKAHRPMMVSGVILHSLPSGYRFDLQNRTLLPPVTDLTPRAQRVPQIERKRMRSLAREIAAEGADSFFVDRRRRVQRDREASE
jgi:cyanophycinase